MGRGQNSSLRDELAKTKNKRGHLYSENSLGNAVKYKTRHSDGQCVPRTVGNVCVLVCRRFLAWSGALKNVTCVCMSFYRFATNRGEWGELGRRRIGTRIFLEDGQRWITTCAFIVSLFVSRNLGSDQLSVPGARERCTRPRAKNSIFLVLYQVVCTLYH